MADDNTKPPNPTHAIQEEAINTLTHQLNEFEELIEQVSDAASKSLNENERSVIHGLLADLKHQHQVEWARLKDMIDARDSNKESLDARGANVVGVEGLRLDKEEEEEHDKLIAGSVQRDSYMRQWFRQKLEPEAEAKTHGIQEGEDFDNDDDAKNVLIKKTMRYERDLYYMFRNLLTSIWNGLDPEGNVTATVYEEFKDCLKWLASGVVDNQVLRCIWLILNVFNKGIERVIGVGKSRKGKEIVQYTKSRRIDKIFNLILEQIQYAGLLWLGTNGTSMDDDLDALLGTAEWWERAHEELKFNVQVWLDTLKCRHCSDSCHF